MLVHAALPRAPLDRALPGGGAFIAHSAWVLETLVVLVHVACRPRE